MDFGSWASWGKKAQQSLLEAVGVADSPADKEYATHRQTVKATLQQLADLSYHLATFTTAIQESGEALQCICATFQALQPLGGEADAPPPAADTELLVVAKQYRDAVAEMDAALKKTCGAMIHGCETTIKAVFGALEEEHAAVAQQQREYDGLRSEVQSLLESGQGASRQKEIEAKSGEMDRLQVQCEQGRAGLDTQFRVMETTAASNVHGASVLFLRQLERFLGRTHQAVVPVPERLEQEGRAKTERLRTVQDESVAKQAAIDAQEREVGGRPGAGEGQGTGSHERELQDPSAGSTAAPPDSSASPPASPPPEPPLAEAPAEATAGPPAASPAGAHDAAEGRPADAEAAVGQAASDPSPA